MPFEQYMLMSLIEPRTLSIGSAIEDLWANPPAEFYSAAKASEIGALFGEKTLEYVEHPETNKIYGDKTTYYVRSGKHFISRDDWKKFLSVFDRNLNN